MRRRRPSSTPVTPKTPPQAPAIGNLVGRTRSQPQDPSLASAPSIGPRQWLFWAALVVAVLLVYQPAWQGGFIWDDEMHVTSPQLRSWQGLYHIWFTLGATEQYYPLLHTAFWLQHRLWGDATLGYHLVNLLLHATSALLVALILRRLAIPGAYLAAAIFALHPVCVESVAWITELKNTLSGVFFLTALLSYLRFDQTRTTSWYLAALGLFVLALLSKTATVMLPAALLVIAWWQRGRLSWRRDVLPVAPFFLASSVAALPTLWIEREMAGVQGTSFQMTVVERCLLAGRVIWFYLGKLFWPADLNFYYPRWQVSQTVWWQYLFPAAALLLVVGLWMLRGRWRGPLAGLLFFVVMLFPVLGFVSVYYFTYSFVADHFQYLASLGVIALVSAGVAMLLGRWRLWHRPVGYAVCLTLLATLGALTWRQSRTYIDLETLYRTSIGKNPNCWIAHNNLGAILTNRGRIDEAIAHYHKALEIKPDHAEAHNNLALALVGRGQVDSAIAHYQKALEIEPHYAKAHNNLALALAGRGQVDSAIAHYQRALEIRPDYAEAHKNLALALAGRGQVDLAIAHYQKALEIQPDFAEAHNNLALALAGRGQVDLAIAHYQKALEIKPDFAEGHNNLALALAGRGQADSAIAHYQKALEIKPDSAEVHHNLALALVGRGQVDSAIAHYRKALEIKPDYAKAHSNLALALAGRGQVDLAIAHYQKALEIRPDCVEDHFNLGNMLANRGRFDEAMAQYRKVLDITPNDRLARRNLGVVQSQRQRILEACPSSESCSARVPMMLRC